MPPSATLTRYFGPLHLRTITHMLLQIVVEHCMNYSMRKTLICVREFTPAELYTLIGIILLHYWHLEILLR